MLHLSRRAFLRDSALTGAAFLLAGCVAEPEGIVDPALVQSMPGPLGPNPNYALMYAPIATERFPIPGIDLTRIDPVFLRQEVPYHTAEAPGTIVIDPAAHYLYYTQPYGRAIRYGVGVGKQGFEWNGIATIDSKQEWPDWYPPPEMIERRPDLEPQLTQLQSGVGVPGGPTNPLGARAMYLWQDGKDTLYRIHGTVEPYSIGQSVSSGCIRMINQDAIDLYSRVALGTQVKVLPAMVG
jgi:lipoprotein-anchoring transpeptidase ErfK/SrfK